MEQLPFIVAGGGIGGLATALALSRRGLASHVLEAAADFREIGAGIQLGPNVFKMFDLLGLTGPIEDIAVFPDNLIMRDALSGELVTSIPLKGLFRERYGYPYAVIHRGDLHAVLLEACRATPLVTLTPTQKVETYVERGDRVVVNTEQGGAYEGVALIGADGLWSKVRAQLLGDGKPRVSGHIAYRGVIPTREVPSHLQSNDVILWAGPKTHLVHY